MGLWIVAISGVIACGSSSDNKANTKKPSQGSDPSTITESKPPVPKVPPKLPPLPKDTGGHTGKHVWSTGFGDIGKDHGRDVAVDQDGNTYAAGLFSGSVDFGTGKKLTANRVDGFVVKYDTKGKANWAVQIGGDGEDVIESVTVDRKGNVFVAGWFSGKLRFADQILISEGADDGFVAQISPHGRPGWIHQFGGGSPDFAEAVAVDKQGRVYVAGTFQRTLTKGPGEISSRGRQDILLACLSPAGQPIWAYGLGGLGIDYARDIDVTAGGNVAFAGEFSGTVTVGDSKLKAVRDRDVVVALLTETGAPMWARAYGSYESDLVYAIASDPSGSVLFTGPYYDEISFGGAKHKPLGRSDAYVVKLDPAGNYLWSKSFGQTRPDAGLGIASDKFGNIAVTGFFQDDVNFGDGVRKAIGGKDAFVLKLSPKGDTLWAATYGDRDTDQAQAVAVDSSGDLRVIGTFHYTLPLGGDPLKSAVKQGDRVPPGDVFVARFTR